MAEPTFAGSADVASAERLRIKRLQHCTCDDRETVYDGLDDRRRLGLRPGNPRAVPLTWRTSWSGWPSGPIVVRFPAHSRCQTAMAPKPRVSEPSISCRRPSFEQAVRRLL